MFGIPYIVATTFLAASPVAPSTGPVDVQPMVAQVDALVAEHWQAKGVRTAAPADDLTFYRRLSLDLWGRIPTATEARAFAADATPEKRARAVQSKVYDPEFSLHFSQLLDDWIQGRFAGDREFVAYLRRSLTEGKGWDRVFRELMQGPWEGEAAKGAETFLLKRVRSVDDLTNDTASAFFGVEVSCAKCHDHPLVEDWKQHHYYGMVSFFNRTFAQNNKLIGERDEGLVSFVDTDGKSHQARLMFLSGRELAEPKPNLDPRLDDRQEQAKKENRVVPPSFSRREQLVTAALEDRQFFSKAIVNKVWSFCFGRGLVHPIDQMHSANPPSIPGVLELLADDLVAHGYDLKRLTAIIASTKAYQLASVWTESSPPPAVEHFGVAQVRELTPAQFALAMVVATGDDALDTATSPEERAKRREQWEGRARGLSDALDPRTDDFQSSLVEALFMSNNRTPLGLFTPAGKNLIAQMVAAPDAEAAVDAAAWAMFSRVPDAEERGHLAIYLTERAEQRERACGYLAWALATSAEFRFNH